MVSFFHWFLISFVCRRDNLLLFFLLFALNLFLFFVVGPTPTHSLWAAILQEDRDNAHSLTLRLRSGRRIALLHDEVGRSMRENYLIFQSKIRILGWNGRKRYNLMEMLPSLLLLDNYWQFQLKEDILSRTPSNWMSCRKLCNGNLYASKTSWQ